MERLKNTRYEAVLALQPTSPIRRREDLAGALTLLRQDDDAVGVIAVSQPSFNPRYLCVEEDQGYMKFAFRGAETSRRQDFGPVYRITGSLYLWRRDFLLNASGVFGVEARYRMLKVEDASAIDIDDEHDLKLAELLITSGTISVPWVGTGKGRTA